MADRGVVLAFSGGLDTSYCAVRLRDEGLEVHTLYAYSGGVDPNEVEAIARRATELGVASHVTVDISSELWQSIVVPFVWSGEFFQGQYPLLVSDRYAIAAACAKRARELGTRRIAHGSTAMGNDQVRFDLTLGALGDFEILAPVRDLQGEVAEVRVHEARYLESRGCAVPERARRYTINENLLGVTLSGSEIDRFEVPGEEARGWCAPRTDWPLEPWRTELHLERGIFVGRDGASVEGPRLLAELNRELARYGVGRGLYTGDTIVGLKGRILFEAPGLVALQAAHRALEEAVLTSAQNRFKPLVGRRWVELVYEGLRYEPLARDLERFLESSQERVTGTVRLESWGGNVQAVAVQSPFLLLRSDSTYAQSAGWSAEEARGFVRLHGLSMITWKELERRA